MTPRAVEIFDEAAEKCRDASGKCEAAVLVEYLCEMLAVDTVYGFRCVPRKVSKISD